MNDDIVDLQTRMAFQDGLLEQLNEVVTSQQKQIDRNGHEAQMESA